MKVIDSKIYLRDLLNILDGVEFAIYYLDYVYPVVYGNSDTFKCLSDVYVKSISVDELGFMRIYI